MCILNNLLRDSDVFLERQFRRIYHHRCKARINELFTRLKIITMVKVDCDRNVGILLNDNINDGPQIAHTRILTPASRYLQNKRSLLFSNAFYNTLRYLHIVHIKRSDCIAVFISHLKHLSRVHQRHKNLLKLNYFSLKILFILNNVSDLPGPYIFSARLQALQLLPARYLISPPDGPSTHPP